jgi:hypothetical protein
MSFIGKPRTTTIEARDLLHVHQRLGLVNFVRRSASADQEDARRRWYMFPSVRRFYVQQGRPGVRPRVRYEEKKKDRVEWFIWEALREKLESRARNPAT